MEFMQINLTWDLFIIVFFVLVFSYSFIIWYTKTLKVVIATYIAILASDWLWNLLNKLLFESMPDLNVFGLVQWDPVFIAVKIALFIISIVILSIKWWFDFNEVDSIPQWQKIAFTAVFWVFSALLLISAILVFASWWSFLEWQWINVEESTISEMYKSSFLVQMIILNYNFFFITSAVAFVILSLTSEHQKVE